MILVGNTPREVRSFLARKERTRSWHPADGKAMSRCPRCLHYAEHKDCADCPTCKQEKSRS